MIFLYFCKYKQVEQRSLKKTTYPVRLNGGRNPEKPEE
jgi:hypothetical protein